MVARLWICVEPISAQPMLIATPLGVALALGLQRWQTLLFVGLLNVVFAAHSGLWGVLVIDMIQFFIKMSAVIAAAYFALKLPQVGGKKVTNSFKAPRR